eukprot:GILK01004716.1.p1 GENE.GILK01004716.1~~GILK01004716.1.p1  ORF type:complete len:863 (+),score=137.81 GILK01004716.1:303-2591(+)
MDENKCIESALDGAVIWLWDCNGTPNQVWTYDASSKTLTNAHGGRCLSAGVSPGHICEPGFVFDWCDPDLDMRTRTKLLVGNLTLEEKIMQMNTYAAPIPRLGIPSYDWWSESLHGVGSVVATSYPTPLGLAATFNPNLLHTVATAISTEARVLNNLGKVGLTFFAPNINIFRDPRWGRGMETYGEDPFLSGTMVEQFVKGLQNGFDDKYVKVVATPKHYAAYSLENFHNVTRMSFDAKVSEADLFQTYLPAFEAAVKYGKARSVMCSYNSVNGAPSCANRRLLQEILRDSWGFEGYVVSDCDAVRNVFDPHHYKATPEESAAESVLAGTDLDCGTFYRQHLEDAVNKQFLTEQDIDISVSRLFEQRFKLGVFDPPARVKYHQLGAELLENSEHRELALQAAQESIVLLKNEGSLLPLDRFKLRSVAVIGPNADDREVILGNYQGKPTYRSTHLDGVRHALKDTNVTVLYAKGCTVAGPKDDKEFDMAIESAKQADVAILYLGLNTHVEDEANDRVDDNLASNLTLPGAQLDLLKAVMATGTPTVLVLVNGGPIAISWGKQHVPAILEAWYGGQAAGNATASILFGDYNPSAVLPVTIYDETFIHKMPFDDMSMTASMGRTYRYMTDKPLWPFGHGLSYSQFKFSELSTRSQVHVGEPFDVTVTVENEGPRAGAKVVLIFASFKQRASIHPLHTLVGFTKIFLDIGEKRTLSVHIEADRLQLYDELSRSMKVPVGSWNIKVGSLTTSFETAPSFDLIRVAHL